MIALLTGEISHILTDSIILNVNQVGYHIYTPPTDLSQLSPTQQHTFYIHTHVREDQITLYGFTTLQNRNTFQLLISVSGIGPKIALQILTQPSHQINHAIQTADIPFFTNIPGIGKKGAQKLILELKNKVGSTKELDLAETHLNTHSELIEALTSLGYTSQEAEDLAQQLPSDITDLQEQIKHALKTNST